MKFYMLSGGMSLKSLLPANIFTYLVVCAHCISSFELLALKLCMTEHLCSLQHCCQKDTETMIWLKHQICKGVNVT